MLDFSSLVRPGSPNTYLLAPEGFCGSAEPDGPAPAFTASPAEVFAAAEAAVRAMERVSDLTTDPQALALGFVQRTKLMRYKDDVDVRVAPQGGGAAMAVYSRSRIGYSDMGQNKRRAEALVEAVRERLGGAG